MQCGLLTYLLYETTYVLPFAKAILTTSS